MPLEGKRIVLTGASGGIGRLLAGELLAEGAALATIGRSGDRPAGVTWLQGDLSSIAGIEAAAKRAADFEPDILINLAGVQYFGPFEDQEIADIERTYLVDLVAPGAPPLGVAPSADGYLRMTPVQLRSHGFLHLVSGLARNPAPDTMLGDPISLTLPVQFRIR